MSHKNGQENIRISNDDINSVGLANKPAEDKNDTPGNSDSNSASFVISRKRKFIAILFGLCIALIVYYYLGEVKNGKALVVIVPGTWGNSGEWCKEIDKEVTFASELKRGMGGAVDIVPFLWDGKNSYLQREQAANNLANLLNKKGRKYDSIHLVGHSHGGNIALLAAGKCKYPIKTVLCLSTPHIYFKLKVHDKKDPIDLPIYLTPKGRDNIETIITFTPNTDKVPDVWSKCNIGIDRNTAVRMTQDWQEKKNYPRIPNDGSPLADWFDGILKELGLFDDDTFAVHHYLNVADKNIVFQSYVKRDFGIAAHKTVKSRRNGYLLGTLIAKGINPDQEAFFKSLVQPAFADEGNPIPEVEHQKNIEKYKADYKHAGWRIKKITATLTPEGLKYCVDKPDLCLTITNEDGERKYKTSKIKYASGDISWKCDHCIFFNETDVIWLKDVDLVFNDELGGMSISVNEKEPPKEYGPDLQNKLYWKAEIDWEKVHF